MGTGPLGVQGPEGDAEATGRLSCFMDEEADIQLHNMKYVSLCPFPARARDTFSLQSRCQSRGGVREWRCSSAARTPFEYAFADCRERIAKTNATG